MKKKKEKTYDCEHQAMGNFNCDCKKDIKSMKKIFWRFYWYKPKHEDEDDYDWGTRV